MIEKVYYQICLLAGGVMFFLGFIKILNYYLIAANKNEGKKPTYAEDIIKRQKAPKQQEEEFQSLLHSKEIAEVNLGSYECAKDLFHDKMQAGELSREQILFLKKVLSSDLGENANLYNPKSFKNEAHFIYSVLKSSYLTKQQLQQFSSYVAKF